MKTNCGIYKIVINNKIYIGSSINLKSRKYAHFRDLKKNKHCNNHLQSAYNKYGKHNSKWEIEEYIENIEDKQKLKETLLNKEQYYLDLYESYNHDKGYNICKKSDNCLGRKFSEETKEKLRKANEGENNPRYGKYVSKNVKKKISNSCKGRKISESNIQKTKERNKKLFTGKKLSEEHKKKISNSCKGRPNVHKNKKLSDKHREKITESNKKRGKETFDKISKALMKKIKNINTNEIFNSISEAAKLYKLNPSHISAVCRNKRKTCGGFKWEYLREKDDNSLNI